MKPIIGLDNICDFIGCRPDTLRTYMSNGLPIAKIGKEYISVDVDLIEFIRSQYRKLEDKQCRSTKEAKSIGLKSVSTGGQLDNLLALKTNDKPKKSTTKLKVVQSEKKVTT